MTGKGTRGVFEEGEPVFETRERIETPHGMIVLHLTSETVARAVSGPGEGWLKVDGRPLWAYAMLRRPSSGDVWIIDPLYGQVMELDGEKAGPRAEAEVRDRAWKILKDAFDSWLPTRPDIVAGVALAARRREETGIEELASELRSKLATVEAELLAARAAREAAEEKLHRALEPAAGPTS